MDRILAKVQIKDEQLCQVIKCLVSILFLGEDLDEFYLLTGAKNINIIKLLNIMIKKTLKLGNKGNNSKETKLQVDFLYLKHSLGLTSPPLQDNNFHQIYTIIHDTYNALAIEISQIFDNTKSQL